MPTSYRQGITKNGNFPGPGTYDVSVRNDGPFYSLRGRNKDSSVDFIPGPGKYSPIYDASMEKVPGCKLGISKRDTDMSSNKSPGPGVYDPKFGSSTPSVNFGKSSRSVSYDNNLPGPGTYELKSTNPGQAYSMTPRRTPTLKVYTPGPGTYTSFMKNQVQTYSLSKAERKGLIDSSDSPGPGAYYPEQPKSKRSNLCNISIDLAKPQERQYKSRKISQGQAIMTLFYLKPNLVSH